MTSVVNIEQTMTIGEKQAEVIEEFNLFDNWTDKYEHIISLGRELPPLSEQFKVDENLVKGCQSRVWLHTGYENGRVVFEADSDAMITKGLVALMIRVLSGHKPKEIVDADMNFIGQTGLRDHLSPNRANGLASMVKQMKMYALAYTVRKN